MKRACRSGAETGTPSSDGGVGNASAGEIACRMAAHAIGHQPDADCGPGQEAVFVVVAHTAGMRGRAGIEEERCLEHVCLASSPWRLRYAQPRNSLHRY